MTRRAVFSFSLSARSGRSGPRWVTLPGLSRSSELSASRGRPFSLSTQVQRMSRCPRRTATSAERALRASRLAELEGSLGRLLAERAIPLRAVRLADGVRSPLASFHDRATEELPRFAVELAELENSAPISAKLCSTPSQLLDGGLATNSAATA